MKEAYTTPEIEVVEFECEDIITKRDIFSPDDNETPVL